MKIRVVVIKKNKSKKIPFEFYCPKFSIFPSGLFERDIIIKEEDLK